MNNVAVIGVATEEQYFDAILKYTDPEDLKIYTIKGCETEELKAAIKGLNLVSHDIVPEVDTPLKTIIYFIKDVGIGEVTMLTQAIIEKTTVILIP